MQEENREGISGALKTLAAVVIVFLLLAALYVGYQAMQVLFPPNTYETALLATVEDTVDAEGVLLFEESYVAGGGTLGYLVADGERVSAGTAVAEIYSDAAQASLRQQLTQINDQIDLLQRSQNTTSVQLESLRKNWMQGITRIPMRRRKTTFWPRTSSGSSPARWPVSLTRSPR